jgi:hypothetical protein
MIKRARLELPPEVGTALFKGPALSMRKRTPSRPTTALGIGAQPFSEISSNETAWMAR